MAEQDIVAIPVEPSDLKRKLDDVESELHEQHPGSLDRSNEVSLDDVDKSSQAKRPKLEDEAADGLGVEKTQESVSSVEKEKTEKSIDEEGEKPTVQDPIHAEESGSKIGNLDENGKPEDNQPGFVEAATSQEVSVEETKEVNTSGSQKEAENNTKEANDDAIAQEEVETESKEANGGSQKEDENESKDVTGDESKEVNGSGSREETGDETKEANGGGSRKEGDDTQSITRRIEVPSSKVGTLIGKGGEMVRHLQISSGAKIQIRRDSEADPNSALRPVEIIGNVAAIEKAEKLINTVIAESEAGGVPALLARAVSEQMEIKVPNDKVGVIIGRGGETIKNMQIKSRARIQLIPQSESDGPKERTVRISGDKRQIDIATALIKDVMYQETRPSHYPVGFNQPPYQPRGPGGPPQWDSRGPHGPHSMPYNYHHGGPYQSHGSHYRPPNSGGYPSHHMPPRSGYGPGWEQRPPPHSAPYDYYGRQGPQAPGPVPSQVPPYSQPGAQQTYGQTYDQPHYDNPPMQQSYGPYGGSQQSYPPAGGQHQMQQPGRPYGVQGSAEQGYGPPRPAAPSGDVPYQGGPMPAAPSYGTSMAPQQQYGYASSAPSQQTYPSYSSAAPSDGYNGTQAPANAPAYEQHGAQPASGVQQTSAGYGQAPPTGGYSSYPSTQPAYGSAPAQNNGNYGYGSQYPSYGGGNASAYAAPVGQTTYSQTAPAQAGYEQSATQPAGYAAAPGTAQ